MSVQRIVVELQDSGAWTATISPGTLLDVRAVRHVHAAVEIAVEMAVRQRKVAQAMKHMKETANAG